jgi:hypothetical protein
MVFDKRRNIFSWEIFLYALLFALLFLQFPLNGRLPGNTDTLLSISLTNLFNEKVALVLSGNPSDTIFYPAKNFLPYGENCFGLGFIFTFFRVFGLNDIWSYYLFLVTIFSLNSFAGMKLFGLFTSSENKRIALVAGAALSLSGFVFANIDDANVIFIFFPLFGLYCFEKGLRSGQAREIKKALLFSSLQIWFGMYVFLFQFLALSIYGAFYRKRLKEILSARDVRSAVLHYSLPALPLVLLYLSNHFQPGLVSPYNNQLSRKLSSLNWYHFLNVLPHNLIYSANQNVYRPEADASLWYSLRKTCFPGVAFPLVALMGFVSLGKVKLERARKQVFTLSALFVLFFILSLGTNAFDLGEATAIPFVTYFRVASRAYLFALIPLTVFFAIGLEVILSRGEIFRRGFGVACVLLLSLLIFAENVPFPLMSYDYRNILTPPAGYIEFFRNLPTRQVVVDLPSDYQALLPQSGSLWTYSRDALYMNWQTYHKQIIVGGINSYLPSSRIEVDRYIKELPDKSAIQYLKRRGVQYLIFHKEFILFPREDIFDGLKRSHDLVLEFEAPNLAVFKL